MNRGIDSQVQSIYALGCTKLQSRYDQVEYLELLTQFVTTHGIYVGSKRSLIDLLAFTAKNSIAPYIFSRFKFQDALSAFHEMEAGRHVGKIIIDTS